MRAKLIAALICFAASTLIGASGDARADVIKFKKGGAEQCVVVKEMEDSICFLSSMGVVTMRRDKIESIEYESDEVNAALEKKWEKEKKQKTSRKKEPAVAKPAEPQKPKVLRTYDVNITIRRIALGTRKAGVKDGQQVATFYVEDFGEVKGNRLFKIDVTSYRSGTHRISAGNFHSLLPNGLRIDPEPLEGYPELDAHMNAYDLRSGYVAFPTNAKLEDLIVRSSLADFDLDLESGQFSIRRGPF